MSLVRVTQMFFDSPLVEARITIAAKKVLSKFGAFTRTTAKQSLRYQDQGTGLYQPGAPAGKPPFVHRSDKFDRFDKKSGKMRATSPLKELIFFSYDEAAKSVVVGPLAFTTAASNAPEVLEHSGTVTKHRNPRRRKRYIGGGGEIRLGGGSKTSKMVPGVGMVTYAKLKTAGQVARAEQFQEALYGPEFFEPRMQAARPFMQPALKKNLPGAAALWQASVN